MGTHLRVLCEGYPMNTNMIGLIRWFSKIFVFLCRIDERILSIGRVNRNVLVISDTTYPESIIV